MRYSVEIKISKFKEIVKALSSATESVHSEYCYGTHCNCAFELIEECEKLIQETGKHILQEPEEVKEDGLNQCPCCKATKCKMEEPCLGCETYSDWLTSTKEDKQHHN